MYRVALAYRHDNREVEGFVGYGFTEESAENDCIRQMRYKRLSLGPFRPENVIRDDTDLTLDELEAIRNDWASGARYNPDGSARPGGNRGPGRSGL